MHAFGQSESTAYTIAYSSRISGGGDIYLTDSEAKSKIQVTDHPDNDGYVAWSPDGKRLAMYAYHDERRTWSIHTMNVDGSNRKRLTHAKNKWDSSPAWSPDGAKIAFARSYSNTEGVWTEELWIMNADGSEQKQLTALGGGGPYFTQDGRIVFHSLSEANKICIADMDGSNMVKLTDHDAKDLHPEVSPDGTQIAFMSNRDEGNHEIYVMNIDGSDEKRLTFSDTDKWYPSWSPDGSKLIFSSTIDDVKSVYIMNKDGSGIKKLIENGSQAAWLKVHE